MTSQVRIVRGEYHYKPVSGVFQMTKPLTAGKRGNFITIVNDGTVGNDPVVGKPCRILVNSSDDFQYLSGATVAVPHGFMSFTAAPQVEAEPEVTETDEEAMDRIANRFSILDEMSAAAINGDIRALIVSGPPGVGKSFGVTQQMEKASLFDRLADRKVRFEVVKGAMSGIGLFATLYKYSDPKNVIVLDDCDIWQDQDALNILKGALDSGKTRRISWNKDSRILRDEGIPNTFNFHGSVIFITNMNITDKKSKNIQPHLEALQSRSHYLDLTINSERDKMLRIRQVHRDATDTGGLFSDYFFENGEDGQILDFMWEHKSKLRELSLRMCLKIADLVKISPKNWQNLAKNTVMR
jgi:hypothetical protein